MTTERKKRGFAAMDPSKQREIASKGGKSAHAQGAAREWNSETAAAAGRKGGQNRAANVLRQTRSASTVTD